VVIDAFAASAARGLGDINPLLDFTVPTWRLRVGRYRVFYRRENQVLIRRKLVRFGVDLFGQQHAHQRDFARPSRIEDFLSDPDIAIDQQNGSDRQAARCESSSRTPAERSRSMTAITGSSGPARGRFSFSATSGAPRGSQG